MKSKILYAFVISRVTAIQLVSDTTKQLARLSRVGRCNLRFKCWYTIYEWSTYMYRLLQQICNWEMMNQSNGTVWELIPDELLCPPNVYTIDDQFLERSFNRCHDTHAQCNQWISTVDRMSSLFHLYMPSRALIDTLDGCNTVLERADSSPEFVYRHHKVGRWMLGNKLCDAPCDAPWRVLRARQRCPEGVDSVQCSVLTRTRYGRVDGPELHLNGWAIVSHPRLYGPVDGPARPHAKTVDARLPWTWRVHACAGRSGPSRVSQPSLMNIGERRGDSLVDSDEDLRHLLEPPSRWQCSIYNNYRPIK